MIDQDLASNSSSSLFQACCHATAPYRAEGVGRDIFFHELANRAERAQGAKPPSSGRLLLQFQQNHQRITQVCRRLNSLVSARRFLPPASEWLLDNQYILDAVAAEIRNDLPKSFYRELPALAEGPFRTFPRVYEFALFLLTYTDSMITETVLREAVEHYQQHSPLAIGELWALPIMVRLVLLENLRRLSDGIIAQVNDHEEAARALELALAGTLPALKPEPSDAYSLALAEALRENDLRPGPINDHLASWAQIHLTNLAEIQRREFCREAADQVSIGNAVTSLRLLDVIDWTVFFESMSWVEKILREDAIYSRQDFATRNRCRNTIERLARGSEQSEAEIARAAITQSLREKGHPVFENVSYVLIGDGLAGFEEKLKYHAPWKYASQRWLLNHPNLFYFGTLAFLTAAGMLLITSSCPLPTALGCGFLFLLCLLPLSEIAIALINYLVTQFIPPRVLPRFDFKEAVPPEYATFLVIPTLIGKAHPPEELVERLEQHYLVNTHLPLWFGLLTDFTDADAKRMERDEADIRVLVAGIERLNNQYASPIEPRFFLFHRKRVFNPAQNCWMGWERKRGKLIEFNRLIRGATDTSFEVIYPPFWNNQTETKHIEKGESTQKQGDAAAANLVSTLPSAVGHHIRFVLTLDADTVLPRDAARQMIATLAHPLNQATSFESSVTSGYSVLQPRVSFLYRMGLRSRFARLFTRSRGIDPYSTAVSDTYMDLFGRGTFTGKGLYDVDAFSACVESFPENHILSHDLIESNYARCGLVSDVEVFDEFPARYRTYAKREHRWIRGDWQLLPWLRGRVPVAGRASCAKDSDAKVVPATEFPRKPKDHLNQQVCYSKNSLPLLERWKILDNLRRSIVPLVTLALLVLSWLLFEVPWGWTLFALTPFLIPSLFFLTDRIISSFRRQSLRGFLSTNRFEFVCTTGQAFLQIAFLVDQAHISADAIARTLYRLCWSRRSLLEWETAASTEKKYQGSLRQSFRKMTSSVTIGLGLGLLIGWIHFENLLVAGPLLLLWVSSPAIAYYVSLPLAITEMPLSAVEETVFREIARRTWSFFETFVDGQNHWLPPDNYQEEPLGVVAQRTSPTNIGVYLLSTLAARDLGYITSPQLIERLTKTFDTLEQLSRWEGHFFNWYDTSSLRPLHPAYVSTVDSGNLLGCLLTLKQGLLEYSARISDPRADFLGLRDTCAILRREIALAIRHVKGEMRNETNSQGPAHRILPSALETIAIVDDFLSALDQAKADKLKPLATKITERIGSWPSEAGSSKEKWAQRLMEMVNAQATKRSECECSQALQRLARRADRLAAEMNFRVLYNPQRDLFAIGFNADIGKLDSVHYDLLASEACLISYLAIARGEVPRKHWFQLGRMVTRAGGEVGLVSWGGTMFEYLMPRLFLSCPPGVLLDQAQRAAVRRQIQYGRETGLPWGISESAYYTFDAAGSYQYQSFGVPLLGFKRGLDRDCVIAPYATLLAADVFPAQVVANLQRIGQEGGAGAYGFYEAIDYTPERLPNGEKRAVVRCYMAHHQGMSLLALTNRLLARTMPRRLFAEPAIRSAELLLEERVPEQAGDIPLPHGRESTDQKAASITAAPSRRRIATADTPVPRTHLLSNGRYTVMITNSGTGFSRWTLPTESANRSGLGQTIDVTRWRPDVTADHLGQFFYLRDRRFNNSWCAAHEPLGRHADKYEVIFALDKADFRRIDEEIETITEITVVPDADVECRRVTVINHGKTTRYLDITSYSEAVLAEHQADLAHPAFAKLFLETEWLPGSSALICHRRRRASDEADLWAFHVLADDLTESSVWGPLPPHGQGSAAARDKGVSYETSRPLFLGRRRNPSHPAAQESTCQTLSCTIGAVLDPVFAIRRHVRIRAGEQIVLGFTTGIADSRGAVLAMADRYHSLFAVNRGFELAFAHSRIELHHGNLRPDEVHLFQRLAGHLFYPVGPLRAPSETIASNQLGQSGLWRHGVSGDIPIALLRLNGPEGLWHLKQLLRAHEYWRKKNLLVDFVVLCEGGGGYFDQAYTEAINDVRGAGFGDWLDKPGGIFVRKGSQMPSADRTLLLSAARLIIDDRSGTLATQSSAVSKTQQRHKAKRKVDKAIKVADDEKEKSRKREKDNVARPSGQVVVRSTNESRANLFQSDFGCFSADGKEYLIEATRLDHASTAPWSNVIANPSAGFVVTDSGSGYTWVGNSQLNRLTPWSNDPVSDPPGEVIYIQDQATGLLWSPTTLPIRADAPVRVTHGHGYTTFQRDINAVAHDLMVGVPPSDPLKISILRLRNTDNQERQLSITYYLEWVLGTNRTATAQHLVTALDSVTGKAMFATNVFNLDFPRAVAFAAASLENLSFSGNRREIIGRNRSLAAPVCFEYQGLSGQVGAGLDPCAALQGMVKLQPGEEHVIVFLLGEAESEDAARQLINHYLDVNAAKSALQQMTGQWEQMVSAIRVETPDLPFNTMMNGWLIYQTLACRFWGRSAFYQSGGAYGFRDQLQDVMALVYSRPDLARTHIFRAASRQFEAGDVQHWWHVPSGNGVRTRFSDDFLWLPLVVCHYVKVTGDGAVLDELVPYLQAEPLTPDKHEVYGPAVVSEAQGSLYDHCVRALHHGWKLGPHGLPLMGCGDWNDGMNRVGIGGKGESVWVAWFQIVCLLDFIPLAEKRNDQALVDECRDRITHLRDAIKHHAWDGRWYRRAYFDDGTPLGSVTNRECQIDSIAQSWAVIAEHALKEGQAKAGSAPLSSHSRLNQAMDEVLNRLCHPDQHLMLLFAPPFDTAPLDPGYIKGYVPGIRENGGQYTHAACWVVQALALLGRADDAYRIYDMINPIQMTKTRADLNRYAAEPYVIAADVYHHPQHVGRAGWTWYTGSSAWYYRVGLENILGFMLRHDRLYLNPVIPSHWPAFSIRFRYGAKTTYVIEVHRRGEGKDELLVDGTSQDEPFVKLIDDGQTHRVIRYVVN